MNSLGSYLWHRRTAIFAWRDPGAWLRVPGGFTLHSLVFIYVTRVYVLLFLAVSDPLLFNVSDIYSWLS